MTKETRQLIGTIYQLCNRATEFQRMLVADHGEHLQMESRADVVEIWNALDKIGAACHTIMTREGISYQDFLNK